MGELNGKVALAIGASPGLGAAIVSVREGVYGYFEDFELAKIYRDMRVCQICEGTSDGQRLAIARALPGWGQGQGKS